LRLRVSEGQFPLRLGLGVYREFFHAARHGFMAGTFPRLGHLASNLVQALKRSNLFPAKVG
jgi:hypothetical protein